MILRSTLALLLATAVPLAAHAQATETKAEESKSAEAASSSPLAQLSPEELKGAEVSAFTLDNGLRVVVIPDNRAPVVTHMVWYDVGSADEPAGSSGIAHFLEHLMFKGTKTVPAGEFSRAIAEIGGTENAFTSTDYTAYFQRIPPDALPEIMRYEADRMENLVLTDEVVLPERDVIIEERNARVENNPGAILSEAVQAALFQNHPYGTPIIGWKHEINQLSLDDAITFYDRFYTPNNAVLVVAGNVKPDEVRRLAEETYGKVKRRAEPPKRALPSEPAPRVARTLTLNDPRVRQPSMQRSYLAPSYGTGETGEGPALDVLGEVLGGSSTSRLYRALVREQEIATSVGAYYRGSSRDDTSFIVYATPKPGHSVAEVEAAIDREIARLKADGVTQDEVDRAAARAIKTNIFSRDSQATLARIYGASLTVGRTLDDVANWPQTIADVKAEDVTAAARAYLQPGRSVTGYLLPEGQTPETKEGTGFRPAAAEAPAASEVPQTNEIEG